MNDKIMSEKETEKYEAARSILSFSLIHALLLSLVKYNKIDKLQMSEILDICRKSINSLPVQSDASNRADLILQSMEDEFSSFFSQKNTLPKF
jgi:hypothetical protein